MDNKIFDLADRLKAAKDKKKELDAMVKEVGAEIERLDLELSDAMTEAECERFSRNGSTFYLSSRLYASPIAGQKEAMFAALKSNGFGEIVTETVNANTLASFVKEQRELNNDEIPEWISEVVSSFENASHAELQSIDFTRILCLADTISRGILLAADMKRQAAGSLFAY